MGTGPASGRVRPVIRPSVRNRSLVARLVRFELLAVYWFSMAGCVPSGLGLRIGIDWEAAFSRPARTSASGVFRKGFYNPSVRNTACVREPAACRVIFLAAESKATSSQQDESRPPIRLTLQQFEAVDLAFHLVVAPGLLKTRDDGCTITDSRSKATEL